LEADVKLFSTLIFGLVLCAGLAPANASTFGTYGDVTTTPSGFLATSVGFNTQGGLYYQLSPQVTLNSITQLSADYLMTQGTFGGGSPRFTIFDSAFHSAWVNFGTPLGGGSFSDPAAGNTGNYADLSSLDLRVASNGFGGLGNGNSYETWAQFVANSGTQLVSYIYLDVDGGFSQPNNIQQVLLNNFTVNDQVLTAAVPEPSSWAMLLIGFAGVGFMAYRRKSKPARLAA
jgi:PEP-CTERM motif-containing protein